MELPTSHAVYRTTKMTGMQKLQCSYNSAVRDTAGTPQWVLGDRAVSPQRTCLPGAAAGAAKFAQLCRADVGKVGAFPARLAGGGREKTGKQHSGKQGWRDVHRAACARSGNRFVCTRALVVPQTCSLTAAVNEERIYGP